MKHPFNCMGLLALPALAALLFLPTGDPAFLGFLGFLVFLRYFWVNPDELFLLTLRQAATAAFVAEVPCWGPCCCSSTSCPRTAAPCPRRWD